MTLYELTGQLLELQEMAQDQELDQKTINDTMEGTQMEYYEKADGYARLYFNWSADIDAINKEIKKLESKKKVVTHNMDMIKKNLKESMIATGNIKFSTSLFSFRVQNTAPSLDVLDETKIPKEFWKPQDPVLGRRMKKESLKKGTG